MIVHNLERVLHSIEEAKNRYNRNDEIKLIAVSKYSQSSHILQAFQAGQIAFGENKVQDLSRKSQELKPLDIEWHFIGTLQENKINMLLHLKPQLLHSLHSMNLANALQKRLERENLFLDTLLQINSANEDTKHGFSIESAYESYKQIAETCSNIRLQGIMCMGAHSNSIKLIEKSFVIAKNLYDKLQVDGAKILSMGMSSDYEIAIANGSNCLRIGSQIFC
ncbi:YggS family pyridoxal phosphate-dependent enzyme [Helicobacter didelphidarum]|uniref:Pyridoxal phosphate homeostasis protein n=1 Tax=Helicobacter didelphidarum TaxID=2040648 RepID=A0A3D8IJ56_9HELI|nr:YggS family pyridoxal phosphate-dependent enzyme [Helicobacter didelphidarum]RDU65367.1 YggS family pyridoxal phosphate-dependent enzyme [Helicobacter didelphidarum]